MKSTIRGMFMLGRGKREGIHEFSNTSDAVLSALAPWIALAVVGNLLPIFMMKFKNIQITYANISLFFVKICCLIATVVIIHCFSALWKKEMNWKQTTTALLWCFWVPFLDCMLFLIIAGLFLSGSPNTLMALLGLVIVLYIAYSIWLNWFVVKVGLQTTTQKSIMVVLALIVASIIIYSIFIGFNFAYITEMMKELQQKQQAIPIP